MRKADADVWKVSVIPRAAAVVWTKIPQKVIWVDSTVRS